jgi:hypothetical protein
VCSVSRWLEPVEFESYLPRQQASCVAHRRPYMICSLVLFYGGSGLRDASGKQVRLDRDFLLR